jgi:hypothetical protein
MQTNELDTCPFCRKTPFINTLIKLYYDKCLCKICENDESCDQYVSKCGHIICKNCVQHIINKRNNTTDNNTFNISSFIPLEINILYNNDLLTNTEPKLYKCNLCNNIYNKKAFSRKQRRKSNNHQCKRCV